MKFDEFDITNLIINTDLSKGGSKTIYLNKKNPFYKAILNNCWSTLRAVEHTYIEGGEKVKLYDLKGFRDYSNPERRRHYINAKTFRTGDILIYKNHNDVVYRFGKDKKLNKNYSYL